MGGLAALAAAVATAVGAAEAPGGAPADPLGAHVLRDTALREAPDGRTVERIGRRTRFGGEQVLAVVARRDGWLGVLHPARPNGRAGWIRARDAALVREPWSLETDLSARRLLVRLHGRVVDRMPVAVGAPGTETPTGRMAVTDRLTAPPGSPYGCCILALSARQPRIAQGWSGGDRLAIHGTTNEATIGRAVTRGCLRVRERDLRRLMRRIPVGAPVKIVP